MRTTKQPKGTLIAVGGGEARGPQDNALADQQQQVSFNQHGVLQAVLQRMKGAASRLLVIRVVLWKRTARAVLFHRTTQK